MLLSGAPGLPGGGHPDCEATRAGTEAKRGAPFWRRSQGRRGAHCDARHRNQNLGLNAGRSARGQMHFDAFLVPPPCPFPAAPICFARFIAFLPWCAVVALGRTRAAREYCARTRRSFLDLESSDECSDEWRSAELFPISEQNRCGVFPRARNCLGLQDCVHLVWGGLAPARGGALHKRTSRQTNKKGPETVVNIEPPAASAPKI